MQLYIKENAFVNTTEHQKNIRFFDISWDSDKDGPGSRVVVYLQGCHLRCPWCHSPHSIPKKPPLLLFADLCRHCGECVAQCPNHVPDVTATTHERDTAHCNACGQCIDVCPASQQHTFKSRGPLQHPNYSLSPDALFQTVAPQLDMWGDIGGITVSGGEPLLQHRPVSAFLKQVKQAGFHTAIETSASLPFDYLDSVAPWTDCWLFGLRPCRSGVDAVQDTALAYQNLQRLADQHHDKIIIRTPLIPGFTDGDRELDRVADMMQQLALKHLQLLPFNPHAAHYYEAINHTFSLVDVPLLSEHRLEQISSRFSKLGLQVEIVH